MIRRGGEKIPQADNYQFTGNGWARSSDNRRLCGNHASLFLDEIPLITDQGVFTVFQGSPPTAARCAGRWRDNHCWRATLNNLRTVVFSTCLLLDLLARIDCIRAGVDLPFKLFELYCKGGMYYDGVGSMRRFIITSWEYT
jgi:hypothetical protein